MERLGFVITAFFKPVFNTILSDTHLISTLFLLAQLVPRKQELGKLLLLTALRHILLILTIAASNILASNTLDRQCSCVKTGVSVVRGADLIVDEVI